MPDGSVVYVIDSVRWWVGKEERNNPDLIPNFIEIPSREINHLEGDNLRRLLTNKLNEKLGALRNDERIFLLIHYSDVAYESIDWNSIVNNDNVTLCCYSTEVRSVFMIRQYVQNLFDIENIERLYWHTEPVDHARRLRDKFMRYIRPWREDNGGNNVER